MLARGAEFIDSWVGDTGRRELSNQRAHLASLFFLKLSFLSCVIFVYILSCLVIFNSVDWEKVSADTDKSCTTIKPDRDIRKVR